MDDDCAEAGLVFAVGKIGVSWLESRRARS